jgi:hypothetical protein
MAGHRAGDGTAVVFDAGVGFSVAWPDGRTMTVASAAADPDLAVLERVARSAAVLDKGGAADLAAEAQARVASLPQQGTAAVDAGVVDLRGSASPTAVCLHVDGADPACSNPFVVNAGAGMSNGALPGYAGSAVISGKWYVFVAASAEPFISRNGGRDTGLATQTARIGDMHIALVVVPDGVDHVQVLVPTSENQAAGTGFERPR